MESFLAIQIWVVMAALIDRHNRSRVKLLQIKDARGSIE